VNLTKFYFEPVIVSGGGGCSIPNARSKRSLTRTRLDPAKLTKVVVLAILMASMLAPNGRGGIEPHNRGSAGSGRSPGSDGAGGGSGGSGGPKTPYFGGGLAFPSNRSGGSATNTASGIPPVEIFTPGGPSIRHRPGAIPIEVPYGLKVRSDLDRSETGPPWVVDEVIALPSNQPDQLFEPRAAVAATFDGRNGYFLAGSGRRNRGGRHVAQLWFSSGGPWQEVELPLLSDGIDSRLDAGVSYNGTTVFIGEYGGDEMPDIFSFSLFAGRKGLFTNLIAGTQAEERLSSGRRGAFRIDDTFYISSPGSNTLWSSKDGFVFSIVELNSPTTAAQPLEILGGSNVNGVHTFYGTNSPGQGFVVQPGGPIRLLEKAESKYPYGIVKRASQYWVQWQNGSRVGEDLMLEGQWGTSRNWGQGTFAFERLLNNGRIVSLFDDDSAGRIEITDDMAGLSSVPISGPPSVAKSVQATVTPIPPLAVLFAGGSESGLFVSSWRQEIALQLVDLRSRSFSPMTAAGLPQARASSSTMVSKLAFNGQTQTELAVVEATDRDLDGAPRGGSSGQRLFRSIGVRPLAEIPLSPSIGEIFRLESFNDGFIAVTDVGTFTTKNADSWQLLRGRIGQIPILGSGNLMWLKPKSVSLTSSSSSSSTSYTYEIKGKTVPSPLGAKERLSAACIGDRNVVLVTNARVYVRSLKDAFANWTSTGFPMPATSRESWAYQNLHVVDCGSIGSRVVIVAQTTTSKSFDTNAIPMFAWSIDEGRSFMGFNGSNCGVPGSTQLADWSFTPSGDVLSVEVTESAEELGNVQLKLTTPADTSFDQMVSYSAAGRGLEVVSSMAASGGQVLFGGQRSDAAVVWGTAPGDRAFTVCPLGNAVAPT
jgi:hypothetical protein